MSDCSLCSEINGQKENNLFFSKIKPNIENIDSRIIYETDNWVVMPTIGALTPGYILLVTKKHYSSLKDCPAALISELNKLVENTKRVIEQVYNMPVILFEHGSVLDNNIGGCCIEHTHIHMLPFLGDISDEMRNHGFCLKKIKSLLEIKQAFENEKPYILYQDNCNNNMIATGDLIPSQYVRKLIAKRLLIPNRWNWRQYDEFENIIKTILVLKPIFGEMMLQDKV